MIGKIARIWQDKQRRGAEVAKRHAPGLLAAYVRGDQVGCEQLVESMRADCSTEAGLGTTAAYMLLLNEMMRIATTFAREVASSRGVTVSELCTSLATNAAA